MPCTVTAEESAYYHEKQREEWTKAKRWDLLATKEQLAGWLCDALRHEPPTAEAERWLEAHMKHEGR